MLAKKLEDLGFRPQLELIRNNGVFLDNDLIKCSSNPSVYVWVECEENGNPLAILYVGKAGSGAKKRCREHINGWIYNKSGKGVNERNSNEIRRVLDNGRRIIIFSRESGYLNIFGVYASINDAEEFAFNTILSPVLNPVKIRGVRVK